MSSKPNPLALKQGTRKLTLSAFCGCEQHPSLIRNPCITISRACENQTPHLSSTAARVQRQDASEVNIYGNASLPHPPPCTQAAVATPKPPQSPSCLRMRYAWHRASNTLPPPPTPPVHCAELPRNFGTRDNATVMTQTTWTRRNQHHKTRYRTRKLAIVLHSTAPQCLQGPRSLKPVHRNYRGQPSAQHADARQHACTHRHMAEENADECVFATTIAGSILRITSSG